MEANEAFASVATPFGDVGLARAAHTRRHAVARAGRGSGGQRRAPPPAARRRLGCARGAARSDRHRRARRRRSPPMVAPRPDPGAQGARGVRGAARRASRGALRGRPAGGRLRRGLRVLGRRPCARRAATRSTRGSTTGCSESPTSATTSTDSGVTGSRRCARRRRPTRGAATRPTAHRTSMPRPTAGSSPRRGARGTSPTGRSRSTRTRCSPAPASPTWRRGSAWRRRVRAGSRVQLTAEIGLWGYEPTPADPFVLNHRNFWRSTMLNDASVVLGTLVGGPGTTTLACLGGAQVDRYGNVNSTLIPGGPFLVGSGGGNDVASVCAEAVVVALLAPERTPPGVWLRHLARAGRARARHRPRHVREAHGRRRADPHRGAGGSRDAGRPSRGRPERVRVGRSSSHARCASSGRPRPTRSASSGAGILAAGSSRAR